MLSLLFIRVLFPGIPSFFVVSLMRTGVIAGDYGDAAFSSWSCCASPFLAVQPEGIHVVSNSTVAGELNSEAYGLRLLLSPLTLLLSVLSAKPFLLGLKPKLIFLLNFPRGLHKCWDFLVLRSILRNSR